MASDEVRAVAEEIALEALSMAGGGGSRGDVIAAVEAILRARLPAPAPRAPDAGEAQPWMIEAAEKIAKRYDLPMRHNVAYIIAQHAQAAAVAAARKEAKHER